MAADIRGKGIHRNVSEGGARQQRSSSSHQHLVTRAARRPGGHGKLTPNLLLCRQQTMSCFLRGLLVLSSNNAFLKKKRKWKNEIRENNTQHQLHWILAFLTGDITKAKTAESPGGKNELQKEQDANFHAQWAMNDMS
jgi:hypothetical protein